jgi:hypothetical protein
MYQECCWNSGSNDASFGQGSTNAQILKKMGQRAGQALIACLLGVSDVPKTLRPPWKERGEVGLKEGAARIYGGLTRDVIGWMK